MLRVHEHEHVRVRVLVRVYVNVNVYARVGVGVGLPWLTHTHTHTHTVLNTPLLPGTEMPFVLKQYTLPVVSNFVAQVLSILTSIWLRTTRAK